MDIEDMVRRMTDTALEAQLVHFKAQQKTASRWVALIGREQKKRRKVERDANG